MIERQKHDDFLLPKPILLPSRKRSPAGGRRKKKTTATYNEQRKKVATHTTEVTRILLHPERNELSHHREELGTCLKPSSMPVLPAERCRRAFPLIMTFSPQ